MNRGLVSLLLLISASTSASEATVAVAANFTAPLQQLIADFSAHSTHRLRVASGSTGGLYTAIRQGAPYDLLLAADSLRPQRLVEEGVAVAGSRCTYAVGRLILWSADPSAIAADPVMALAHPALRHLAIANPDTAPYGVAAREVLEGLGLWQALAPRLVRGMDIGQTYQMVATGNAEIGFVAASSLPTPDPTGSRWEVPPQLYSPLTQDAVLLQRAQDNPAALAFLRYLGSAPALQRIAALGYAPANRRACGKA